MKGSKETRIWSREEFGHAELGNSLRTMRLTAIAESVADIPAGRVTEVFEKSAEREGAYRLLENDKVETRLLVLAAQQATAKRCRGERQTPFRPSLYCTTAATAAPPQARKNLFPIVNSFTGTNE